MKERKSKKRKNRQRALVENGQELATLKNAGNTSKKFHFNALGAGTLRSFPQLRIHIPDCLRAL